MGYGETVAKSRLPIMWALDKTCKFTFTGQKGGKMTVQIEGLGLQPSKQALDLYDRAMEYSGLDPTTCSGEEDECVEAEVEAAGKYLSDKWKSTIREEEGKITRIMKTTYDKTLIKVAVKALQGKNQWGKIFYAMIVASPLRFTSIVFEDGTVYATTEIKEIIQEPKYTKYHFYPKAELASRNTLSETKGKFTALAEKHARSGSNFGRMIAYGTTADNIDLMGKYKIRKADVSAITNLFTWCAGTAEDELPQCTGKKPGRVGWAPYPKP